jgi:hypothetical protein
MALLALKPSQKTPDIISIDILPSEEFDMSLGDALKHRNWGLG